MRPKPDVLKRNNVQVVGKASAQRTLLFAHGFGTDQTVWKYIWPAFTNEYRIVLFDLVGANDKTVGLFNAQRYSHLAPFADDLLDLVEALNLTDVVLVGHSVGAITGVLAAISEPARFVGLALISASPRYLNEEGYEGGFTLESLESLFKQMTGNYYTWASGFAPIIAMNPNNPDVAARFAETLNQMRPDVGLAIARTIFHSDHRADLSKLTQPTLILQPQYDIAVPEFVGQYMAKVISQAQLIVMPTEGHLPHLSHPKEVTEALRTFLDRVPAYGLESI